MSRFRSTAQCAALMMALSLLCPSVRADYVQLKSGLTNFTGSLHAAAGSIAVNYTVFAKGGAGDNWTTQALLLNGGTPQVLGGALTGTESFVFFYQLHSNLGTTDELKNFAASGFFTSMGYIDQRAFKDPSLSPLQNIVPEYRINASATQPEQPLGPGATVTLDGPLTPGPAGQPQIVAPIAGGSYLDTSVHVANFELALAATNYTPVLFATSNASALLLTWNTYGSIQMGDSTIISLASPNNQTTYGIAGTATPEPGTMILSAVGLSALGGLGLLRRRRQKTEAKSA